MNKCKCCNEIVTDTPWLHYVNMPDRAQNFPSKDDLEMDKGDELNIYQCPYCGLIQLFNEPVEYYRDVIRAVAVSDEMREFRKDYFCNFIEKCNLKGKKVVEIGAGCGEYMEMVEKQQVDVYGIEHSKTAVQIAKGKGLKIFEGFVEDNSTLIPCSPYDGFYIMNFLEHIPNPRQFLLGIANNLTENGYGLIEVPNGDFIIKNHMISEFMLDHLSYFTTGTLKLLLETSGFEVLNCQVIWHDYIISAIVRKRKKCEISGFQKEQERLKQLVDTFVEKMKAKDKNIAIWGAGHQALAIMALTQVQSKVICVIDSASFKQNRFTPATHIPIYGPDKIEELKIGAIMVMAGSYSTEVIKIISSRFPWIEAEIIE